MPKERRKKDNSGENTVVLMAVDENPECTKPGKINFFCNTSHDIKFNFPGGRVLTNIFAFFTNPECKSIKLQVKIRVRPVNVCDSGDLETEYIVDLNS